MDDRFKKRFTYADTQKEDYVDSPLPDNSAPILARAAAAWNENGDPGVKAFIVTLSDRKDSNSPRSWPGEQQ